VMVIIANLLTDLAYRLIDPRMRGAARGRACCAGRAAGLRKIPRPCSG
jgi:hypothetical protein